MATTLEREVVPAQLRQAQVQILTARLDAQRNAAVLD
jgi:hypothetical protein